MNRNCMAMRLARGGAVDAPYSVCHYFPSMVVQAIAAARKTLRLRSGKRKATTIPQCFDKMPTKAAKVEKQELALRDRIKRFVAKVDKLECLPVPSSGDCWLCCMHDKEGKSWGEHSGDNEHIVSHVKEGYLHGSLILNSLKAAGYRQPGFIWQMANSDKAQGRKAPYARVKRALRRYLYRQCGLVA